MIDNLSLTVLDFSHRISKSFSADEILQLWHVNWSTKFRRLSHKGKITPLGLKRKKSVIFVHAGANASCCWFQTMHSRNSACADVFSGSTSSSTQFDCHSLCGISSATQLFFERKENSSMQEKARSRCNPAQTITEADYADDIALQANAKQHSLERVAGGIGHHVNADITEYMCFNQSGDICTLNGGSLKLVDKFTYYRSSI